MKKRFNTTGSCNPEWHYMVDTSAKLAKIEEYIDDGLYFTINRARQFGKTTTLDAIYRNLSDKYIVIAISFEVGGAIYDSEERFCNNFEFKMSNAPGLSIEHIEFWSNKDKSTSLEELSSRITAYCKLQSKPVLLLIDEVDKSTNNQMFLDFLGMLRNKYLERSKRGLNSTFHSVILAGVYDVKNLKLKIRPESEQKYNSPWNIAIDFDIDMTFHPEEIVTMLDEYEADYQTGMDKAFISREIYKYTSGYPYLVSEICNIIHNELDKDWSLKGIQEAVKIIIKDRENTLLGSLTKNIETYPEFEKLMTDMLLGEKSYTYEPNVPAIELAMIFSVVKEDETGHLMVHNQVFEQKLYNYLSTKEMMKSPFGFSEVQKTYIVNGKLNMPYVIERFQSIMQAEYRRTNESFLESQGRLLFLCFLKPIINGTGFYYVEPETRNGGRMDIVVTYGGEEFVIELKIWRGEKYETEGKVQLAEYLKIRNLNEGYLVTFSFLKNKVLQEEPEWIEYDGKRIYEAVI